MIQGLITLIIAFHSSPLKGLCAVIVRPDLSCYFYACSILK
jgi:hypothetical protein